MKKKIYRILWLVVCVVVICGSMTGTSFAANVTTVASIPQSTSAALAYLEANVGAVNAKYTIPGLMQSVTRDSTGENVTTCTGMVPQAMTFAGNGKYILISAYCDCGADHRSVIYMIDGETKEYITTLILDANMHAGGIAWDGTYIWVCDSASGKYLRAYKYSSALNAIGHNYWTLYTAATQPVATTPSYLCYANGYLYVGAFSTTATETKIYYYSHSDTTLTKEGSFTISGATKIQGISVRGSSMVITSSYGRTNTSKVYVFVDSANQFKVSDVTYKTSDAKTYNFANMVEGCYIGSTYTYFLFESGAKTYRESINTRPLDKYVRFRSSALGIDTSGAGPADGVYVIKSAVNADYAIDIEGQSPESGANAHLWTRHYENSQRFVFQRVEDTGYYTIRNLNSGKYLDVSGGSSANGTNVQQYNYNGSDAQLWTVSKNSDGTYVIKSKCGSKALDLTGGNAADGTNIEIWEYDGSANLKWYLEAQNILPDDIYKFGSKADTNYVLNVAGNASNDGANVWLWERANDNGDRWVVESSADGYCYIRELNSGKYLDVDDGTAESGTNVQIWTGNGTDAQKWSAIPNADGSWSFASCLGSGLYLDVSNGTAANEANVQLWTGNGTDAQKWILSSAHTHEKGRTLATVAPTCTAQGYTIYSCALCGESYIADETEALGHSYGYTDNGDGTHTATCASCGDSFTEDHTFTDGTCVCGAVESTEPTLDSAISIGQQLSLESDLSLTFRIKESQLTNYDLSTAYLVVERDIYPTGGEMYVKTDMLTEYTIENSRLAFVYSGISAAQMNDEIRVTLHIKDRSGKDYVSNPLVTSVTAYAKLLLDAYGTTNAKLCTVLMDMLNYGTAAQIYFDRHADAPANTAYAEFANYASYASADFVTPLEDLSSVITNSGATATMNLSVELATQIGIVYKVTLPSGVNAADAVVVVKDEDGNELETLNLANATVDSKGRYVVTYFGTPSRLMRRVVYGTVYVDGAAISNTYGYSISTYAYQIANTAGMPEALVNLTNLMTMYGDAANAYFGS